MKYDAIVIGAGLSGVGAARCLTADGLTVLMLEAQNRVGGRIDTILTSTGFPIELGAMLFDSGTAQEPTSLCLYMQQLNLDIMPVDSNHANVFDANGHSKTVSALQKSLSPYYQVANDLIQAAKNTTWKSPPSLAEVLKYYQDNIPAIGTPAFLARQTITAMLEHHTGAPIANTSILQLNEPSTGELAIALGGYQRLMDDLHQQTMATGKFTLQLQSPVTKIYHDNDNHTRVVTKSGVEYTAKTVLCTIPLGVLKQQTVQFFPPLSKEKQKAINQLEVGQYNKVILEFAKNFLPEDMHYVFPGSVNLTEWPEYFNLYPFSGRQTPILIANFYANAARFKQTPDDELIKVALQPLINVFGKKVSTLVSATVTHWDTDIYARGSFSYCGLQYDPQVHEHLAKPEGNLYFAGEHTALSARSTIEGAYTSGLRAGFEMAVYLRERKQLTHESHPVRPRRH